MSTANKVLIHRWFEEVWNKKREAAIHEMLHPEVVIYGLGIAPSDSIRGPEEFVPFWKKFTTAIPDLTVSVESTVAEDDQVAVRCSVRGKHSGFGVGVAPTYNSISVNGMVLAHIKKGKIYEAWNNFDFLLLYQQMGILRLPSA